MTYDEQPKAKVVYSSTVINPHTQHWMGGFQPGVAPPNPVFITPERSYDPPAPGSRKIVLEDVA